MKLSCDSEHRIFVSFGKFINLSFLLSEISKSFSDTMCDGNVAYYECSLYDSLKSFVCSDDHLEFLTEKQKQKVLTHALIKIFFLDYYSLQKLLNHLKANLIVIFCGWPKIYVYGINQKSALAVTAVHCLTWEQMGMN